MKGCSRYRLLAVLTTWCYQLAAVGADSGSRERKRMSRTMACDFGRKQWRDYYAAYDVAAQATASANEDERAAARTELAQALLERTKNVSDVLSCNVGVIAGYFIIARLASPLAVESMGLAGDEHEGLAYRLLQLALIFIFTLRNANRIPEQSGAAWGISERSIIPAIMQLRKTSNAKVHERLRRAIPIAPSFRDLSLRIAVVSICAYPPDHPLNLPKVTPPNRDAYVRRHGYELRLHMEPPVIGAHGLGLQHAKLATVLSYLQFGDFDWVAWLDFDSILMNMERTLDSIIYQYTQKVTSTQGVAEVPKPVCGAAGSVDVAGKWLDSWVPRELQAEAEVRIHRRGDGTLEAAAPQFGIVQGRMLDDDKLSADFADGTLHGQLMRESSGAERIEWENGAEWIRAPGSSQPRCRKPCTEPGPQCNIDLDPEIDLLITEEGWGLSSANWLVRRSAWSMNFLHAALSSAHVDMKLFGDQDGMILHLMNEQSLQAAMATDVAKTNSLDPLDRHAAIIPQFELNAYDSLNALTMECDTFVEGDLLVTFPQCKEAEGCNSLFKLAADYGEDLEKALPADAGAWWLRAEGQPMWRRYDPQSSTALRLFGPRPVIREIFLREQLAR